MNDWYVYLVECSDRRRSFYCGATNDLPGRIAAHNDGTGAKFTRGRGPVRLVSCVSGLTKSEALKLEIEVKKKPRWEKIKFLNAEVFRRGMANMAQLEKDQIPMPLEVARVIQEDFWKLV